MFKLEGFQLQRTNLLFCPEIKFKSLQSSYNKHISKSQTKMTSYQQHPIQLAINPQQYSLANYAYAQHFYQQLQSCYQQAMKSYTLSQLPTQQNIIKSENSQEIPKIQQDDSQQQQKDIKSINFTQQQAIIIEQLPPKEKKHGEKTFLKNMPKNFSKAIVTLIQSMTKIQLDQFFDTREEVIHFLEFLQEYKKKMKNLKHLRELWLNEGEDKVQKQINKAFRILSNHFFKRKAVQYIFHSRISDTQHHLTHHRLFVKAVKSPTDFRLISKI